MPAHFLKDHKAGGYRYQRAIPVALQPYFGGRQTRNKYIPRMARREAERIGREYATADDGLFKHLRGLTADDAAALADIGDVDLLQDARDGARGAVAFAATIPGMDVAEAVECLNATIFNHPQLTTNAGEIAQHLLNLQADVKEHVEPHLAVVERTLLRAHPAREEFSFDGLFKLWVKVKEPKRTEEHARSLRLFKSFMGARDYREITATEVRAFCDDLERQGSTKIGCVKHLDNIRGLFSAAVARAIIPGNPGAGVRPDGKIVKGKPLSFTGADLATILAKAESTGFGGKAAVGMLWALRLLTWTGARPREIFQLRKDDIGKEGGVNYIHIREGHPLQSVKTGNARKVPLAPAVAGFVEYAAVAPAEWIFGEFTHDSRKGRSHRLISEFPKFRRDVCGILDKKKTLYSIRHRFHDALDNAGIPLERQYVIVGHVGSDVHSKYGQGAGLRQLAIDVGNLKPFEE